MELQCKFERLSQVRQWNEDRKYWAHHQSSIQYRMRSVEGGDIIDKDDIDTTIRDRFNVTEITNMSALSQTHFWESWEIESREQELSVYLILAKDPPWSAPVGL